jgi:hypothetical protein
MTDAEGRFRRKYVADMYDGARWKERVAMMPRDQITAIYLRFIQNPSQPRPATPEALDIELNKSPQSYEDLRLF